MPYQVYCKLVHMCIEKKLFGENSSMDTNVANRFICPVEIKMLAVLQILGRNWNFDDVAEATLMGKIQLGEHSIYSVKILSNTTVTNTFTDQPIYS